MRFGLDWTTGRGEGTDGWAANRIPAAVIGPVDYYPFVRALQYRVSGFLSWASNFGPPSEDFFWAYKLAMVHFLLRLGYLVSVPVPPTDLQNKCRMASDCNTDKETSVRRYGRL